MSEPATSLASDPSTFWRRNHVSVSCSTALVRVARTSSPSPSTAIAAIAAITNAIAARSASLGKGPLQQRRDGEWARGPCAAPPNGIAYCHEPPHGAKLGRLRARGRRRVRIAVGAPRVLALAPSRDPPRESSPIAGPLKRVGRGRKARWFAGHFSRDAGPGEAVAEHPGISKRLPGGGARGRNQHIRADSGQLGTSRTTACAVRADSGQLGLGLRAGRDRTRREPGARRQTGGAQGLEEPIGLRNLISKVYEVRQPAAAAQREEPANASRWAILGCFDDSRREELDNSLSEVNVRICKHELHPTTGDEGSR